MRRVRVLVTGGSGFVGGAVIKALAASHPEFDITSLDIRDPGAGAEKERVRLIKVDVCNTEEVRAALEETRPDVVVHTAGVVPTGPSRYNRSKWDTAFRINVKGTANVLDAARACGASALVYTSTCCIVTDDYEHEYPNYDETLPTPESSSTYGETKAKAEKLVLAANSEKFATCALRPSVILGEGDYQLVPSIHACIAKGETPFVVGTGDNLFDFTYVGNVADAHVLAVENLLSTKTASGEMISISNGQPVTFRDFCLAVWGAFGHAPPFTLRIPGRMAWLAGGVLDWGTRLLGFSAATLSKGSVNDAIGTRYANIGKARELLGYEPRVSLDHAVRISCEAYKKRLAATNVNGKA